MEAAHRQIWEELTVARERLATNLGLRGSSRRSVEQTAREDAHALVPEPTRHLRGWCVAFDAGPVTESLAARYGASVATFRGRSCTLFTRITP